MSATAKLGVSVGLGGLTTILEKSLGAVAKAGSGNLVDCSALPHAEQTLLRESLGLLSLLQKRIGFDFLGGTG